MSRLRLIRIGVRENGSKEIGDSEYSSVEEICYK